MSRRLLPALLLLVTLALPGAAIAADVFGRPEAPTGSAQPAAEPEPADPAAAIRVLPEPLRGAVAGLVEMQTRLNGDLRAQLRLARDGASWRPALAILAISFLYGVFHAVGPGHGKVVVGGYFLSRRARLGHGLAMSLSSAMVQSVSAIVLVGVLAAVFDIGTRRLLDHAATLEMLSYAGIAALGLWMAWGSLTDRVCCDHEHGDEGHDHHEHEHHEHAHAADCACGHDHAEPAPAPKTPAERGELLRVILTGAAIGIRPCSGAIMVLLFTLAHGIFTVGILSTFAMGVGVAITVATVSLTTVGLNRGLSRLGGAGSTLSLRLRKAAAVTGGGLIAAFGFLQLALIYAGILTPMAG